MASFGCNVLTDHSAVNPSDQASSPTPAATATVALSPTASPTPAIAAEDPEFDVRRWMNERAQAEPGHVEQSKTEAAVKDETLFHSSDFFVRGYEAARGFGCISYTKRAANPVVSSSCRVVAE